MNKFSSLSTSVLLALLTSSAAVSAYANGLENLNSRTSTRSSNVSDETNTLRLGDNDSPNSSDSMLDPISLPSINSKANDYFSEDIVFQADKGNYIAYLAPKADDQSSNTLDPQATYLAAHSTPSENHNAVPYGSSQDVLSSSTDSNRNVDKAIESLEQKAKKSNVLGTNSIGKDDKRIAPALNIELARSEHNINLLLAHDHFQAQPSSTYALPSAKGLRSVAPHNAPAPDHSHAHKSLNVAFDYPPELKESFMVAGDTTVISYSADDSNFMITLKVTPLDVNEQLSFEDFKARLLQRFSDKNNMLFGEYEILSEIRNTTEALSLSQANTKRSVFNYPIDPNDHYMELSLRAYLKKGADGVLPDMQNYFYERSIVSHNYIATLSCELFGRQVQASLVKQQFEALAPLCERILQSYQYQFN